MDSFMEANNMKNIQEMTTFNIQLARETFLIINSCK